MNDASAEGERAASTGGTKKKSILRTTLLVLPLQLVFGVGEVFLPILLVRWFGLSAEMDVYTFAWMVFAFAGSLVFSAFKDSPLVPVIAEERLSRPRTVPTLIGSVLLHTWVVGGALAVLVGGLALGWFAIRYDGPHFVLAAWMVVPLTLYLVTMATRTFFTAILTVEQEFAVQPIASGIGMIVNVTVLATMHSQVGVGLVPIAALAGECVIAAILAWFCIRIVGVKIELNLERPRALMRIAQLVVYEVGGGAVTRVNPVVDQLLAGLSGIAGAGVTLRYSGDVALLPTSLLQAALLPVLLSHLSEDFARRDLAKLRATVVRALGTVILLLLAASVLLFVVRAPLLRFVFLRGEATAEGVDRMIDLMPYHLVGLAPFGALLVLARAHVALKNSSIMIGMGILNAGCNAIFNVILLKVMGLRGIALATSCVHLAIAVVFWFRLESRIARVRASPDEDP